MHKFILFQIYTLYNTSFIYGGDLTWRDLGNFINHQGYNNTEGKQHIFNSLKVEKNGASGVKDALTAEEIDHAKCIIVASDRQVEMARDYFQKNNIHFDKAFSSTVITTSSSLQSIIARPTTSRKD